MESKIKTGVSGLLEEKGHQLLILIMSSIVIIIETITIGILYHIIIESPTAF